MKQLDEKCSLRLREFQNKILVDAYHGCVRRNAVWESFSGQWGSGIVLKNWTPFFTIYFEFRFWENCGVVGSSYT